MAEAVAEAPSASLGVVLVGLGCRGAAQVSHGLDREAAGCRCQAWAANAAARRGSGVEPAVHEREHPENPHLQHLISVALTGWLGESNQHDREGRHASPCALTLDFGSR